MVEDTQSRHAVSNRTFEPSFGSELRVPVYRIGVPNHKREGLYIFLIDFPLMAQSSNHRLSLALKRL